MCFWSAVDNKVTSVFGLRVVSFLVSFWFALDVFSASFWLAVDNKLTSVLVRAWSVFGQFLVSGRQ